MRTASGVNEKAIQFFRESSTAASFVPSAPPRFWAAPIQSVS